MSAVRLITRKVLIVATASLFCLLVLGNVVSSQTISPTYIRVLEENRAGVIYYLTHIRPLPLFTPELTRYKNRFGATLEKNVFEKEIKRKNEINKQEELLMRNPQARDVLYNLAMLYKESGDRVRAENYLKRARQVDPTIK